MKNKFVHNVKMKIITKTVSTLFIVLSVSFSAIPQTSNTSLPQLKNCRTVIDLDQCDCKNQMEIRQQIFSSNPSLNNTLEARKRNLFFYNTMNMIAEPSSVSSLLNVTINNNPAAQKKPFILDANAQVPIALGGKQWNLNTLHVIPQFKVRIFQNDISQNDSSLPVRTPSYMPGLVYYFGFKNLYSERQNIHKFWFGGIKAFHHSNGQDQEEFTSSGKINTYNGNFGEQVVFETLGGYFTEFGLNDRNIPTRCFYSKIGLEIHPRKLTNQDFLNYKIYGRNRINIQSGLSIINVYDEYIRDGETCYIVAKDLSKERWRFIFNFSYILDKIYNTGENINNLKQQSLFSLKRLNTYFTVHYVIPGSINAAAFVQTGYWGSDQYNIYFQQSIFQFQIGLSFAFFKYPKRGDLQSNN
jgi:hypothetical protein